jgi:hypothetical protein
LQLVTQAWIPFYQLKYFALQIYRYLNLNKLNKKKEITV